MVTRHFWKLLDKKLERLYFRGIGIRSWFLGKRLGRCGQHLMVHRPVWIKGKPAIEMGNNIGIGAFAHMWGHGGIIIGDRTLIGSGAMIISLMHDPQVRIASSTLIHKKVVIGSDVWIGAGAIVMPGVHIGNGAI